MVHPINTLSLDSSDVPAKHIHLTIAPRIIEITLDITIWVHPFTVIIVCVLGKETLGKPTDGYKNTEMKRTEHRNIPGGHI